MNAHAHYTFTSLWISTCINITRDPFTRRNSWFMLTFNVSTSAKIWLYKIDGNHIISCCPLMIPTSWRALDELSKLKSSDLSLLVNSTSVKISEGYGVGEGVVIADVGTASGDEAMDAKVLVSNRKAIALILSFSYSQYSTLSFQRPRWSEMSWQYYEVIYLIHSGDFYFILTNILNIQWISQKSLLRNIWCGQDDGNPRLVIAVDKWKKREDIRKHLSSDFWCCLYL